MNYNSEMQTQNMMLNNTYVSNPNLLTNVFAADLLMIQFQHINMQKNDFR